MQCAVTVRSGLTMKGTLHSKVHDQPQSDKHANTKFKEKIWKGRRLRYRFGGRVNVFCSGNVYSETMPTNVITY
jgi:hypothetical protein